MNSAIQTLPYYSASMPTLLKAPQLSGQRNIVEYTCVSLICFIFKIYKVVQNFLPFHVYHMAHNLNRNQAFC